LSIRATLHPSNPICPLLVVVVVYLVFLVWRSLLRFPFTRSNVRASSSSFFFSTHFLLWLPPAVGFATPLPLSEFKSLSAMHLYCQPVTLVALFLFSSSIRMTAFQQVLP
jgi:hypothetical protein